MENPRPLARSATMNGQIAPSRRAVSPKYGQQRGSVMQGTRPYYLIATYYQPHRSEVLARDNTHSAVVGSASLGTAVSPAKPRIAGDRRCLEVASRCSASRSLRHGAKPVDERPFSRSFPFSRRLSYTIVPEMIEISSYRYKVMSCGTAPACSSCSCCFR